MRSEDLFAYAKHLDVTVEWSSLHAHDGEYRHDLSRVVLRHGMSPRLERWTLAHELGHASFGDIRTANAQLTSKQERRADEWAALALITIDDYREVENLHGGHVPAMAHDLGVVSRGVRAYQHCLERLGDEVYLKPCHGSGQWTARQRAE